MPFRFARYVLREVLPLYAAGFVLFLALSTTDLISSIAGVLLRNDIPFSSAVQLYLARLPYMLNLQILPLAVPFAILIGFGRLAKDSELKALAAGGVRPIHALWPVTLLGLAVSAAVFYNANMVLPAANARWNDLWTRAFYNAPPSPPQQHRYTYRQGDTLFYAGSVQPFPEDPTRASLSGVMVQTPKVTYTAPGGIWNARTRTWEISGAYETRDDEPPRFDPATRTFAQRDRLRETTSPPEQLTLAQLRANVADGQLDSRERRANRFELYRRYADPLTALGFALASGALGLLLRNRGWAFASIIMMIFGAYVVWSAMPQMVKLGALPEMVAAWLPNVLLLLFTLVLARRLL